MTDRLRRRRHGLVHDGPMAVTLALTAVIALTLLIAGDVSNRSVGQFARSAALSIDPLAGTTPARAAQPPASAPGGSAGPSRPGYAWPTTGELVVEGGAASRGAVLFIDGLETAVMPAVVDSVLAGRHVLELKVGARSIWRGEVDIRSGRVNRLDVTPAAAMAAPAAAVAPPAADTTATPR